MPCTPARARRLLDAGRAAVYRRTPFTLILQDRSEGEVQPVAFQADPGSKITGIALVGDFPKQGRVVLWAANLAHRGEAVRKRLTDRRSLRRSRRGRKTRYRSKRADNRTLPANWMPPSKHSRVGNVRTWCSRLLGRVPMSGAHIANRPKNTPDNAADGNAIAVGAAVQACGLPVSFWSAGRTKRNRVNQGYPKAHWIDAACVGEDGAAVKLNPQAATLNIAATGRGRRQVVLTDEHGFPRGRRSGSSGCRVARSAIWYGSTRPTGNMLARTSPASPASRPMGAATSRPPPAPRSPPTWRGSPSCNGWMAMPTAMPGRH